MFLSYWKTDTSTNDLLKQYLNPRIRRRKLKEVLLFNKQQTQVQMRD